MNTPAKASGIHRQMPLLLVLGTTLIALFVSIISLLSGWLTIFQNLFYIPIILACIYYTRRGFFFSVLLSCTYLVLMLFVSQDPVVIEGALVRVVIFVLVAGVVTYISTGRMQAEEALRESEARYSALFDNNYSVALLIDPDTGRIVEANEAACRYYGFSREQMLAQGIFDLNRLPMDKVVKDLQRAKNEGRKHFFSAHYLAGGERRVVEIYSGPITVQGKPLFYSIIHDITDRKRAEEALQQSEKRYRDFFITSRDAVFITSPDGRWIDFNDAALEMFGYGSREELMALPVAALYAHPEDRRALMRRIETNDYVKEHPVRLIRKDGSVIDTLVTSVPLCDKDGSLKAFIGSIRDITERKKVEMELFASKQLIESIIDTIPARVFWKDRNLVYLGCNTQFANDAGYSSPEEIIGKDDFQMGWRDQAERYQADDRAVIENGKARLFIEEPQTTPQGTTIHLLTNKVPLHNEEGEIIGVLGTYLDITDRKRAEEALHQVNKKLQLMSSVTRHDILNQLTVLRGYLELSGDYINDPVRLKEFMEKEERAAATIESQIRFTRDYQDLGVQAPSWQHVRACIENAAGTLPMGNITADMAGTDFEIFADPLCEKVFYNLIDNALRYGGDRMTTIRFSSQESEQGMTLVVEDDGTGISPEDRKRLFERGFGKNTGLGLFLSREILSITGITITETGTPGCGARFEIVIPKGAYRISKEK